MRDKLNEQEWWDVSLELVNDSIILWKNELAETSDNDYHGLQSSYTFLWADYLKKIRLLYSSGAGLEEIKAIFPEFVSCFEKSWTNEFGYVELIWAVSIGIMLEISSDAMQPLQDLVQRDNYSDYLLDFMFNSIDPSWKRTSNEFNDPNPYEALRIVIESQSSQEAIKSLKDYLSKKWYKGHNDMGWYNSHKKSNYVGYWSFESGAIAKILKLDDTGWENEKYYPYDMVHYNDNK